ncbi:MAG: FAD-dependent oxidoreductase [Tistlia sp.]|uniref:FAD-dependent oxidoreductase n=1 Tax=Tistlia sp. TaxID=3057121 RepID=UPI0034A27F7A
MIARVAVVGSGPAGLFLADALSRSKEPVAVDVLERLPFPFGLIRYGVAPDHQGTKAVTRNLARVMERPRVRFFGGLAVGEAITLETLRDLYDAVVVAAGAAGARRLEFPGSESPLCVTGFDLARWVNGHPDYEGFRLPDGIGTVAILGHGNVALDVARLFVKQPDALAASDAAEEFVEWRRRSAVECVTLCGRGTPESARFSQEMLEELRDLPGVELLRDEPGEGASSPGAPGAAGIIARLPEAPRSTASLPVRLLFGAKPLRFEQGRLTVDRQGEVISVPAGLVVQAVGQVGTAIAALASDATGPLATDGGEVLGWPGVFVAGWAAGAATGTIPDSRSQARVLAPRVLEAAERAAGAAGDRADLADWLRARGHKTTSWEDWLAIDRLELTSGAAIGACRRKMRSLEQARSAGAG